MESEAESLSLLRIKNKTIVKLKLLLNPNCANGCGNCFRDESRSGFETGNLSEELTNGVLNSERE